MNFVNSDTPNSRTELGPRPARELFLAVDWLPDSLNRKLSRHWTENQENKLGAATAWNNARLEMTPEQAATWRALCALLEAAQAEPAPVTRAKTQKPAPVTRAKTQKPASGPGNAAAGGADEFG